MKANFSKDNNVLIMGLGNFGGGADAAIFAAKSGASVIVTDLGSPEKFAKAKASLAKHSNIDYHLGYHDEADFRWADIVIVNPAVAPNNKYISIARDAGAVITSQIEIFFEMCKCTTVAITGANGKSTTTALTAHLLNAGLQQQSPQRKVWLGGNIGNMPLLDIVEDIKEDDVAILEISSFQAEQLAASELAPKISLITNLSPNHLDRHKTYQAYCNAKESLFRYQSLDENAPAISIFNLDDEITAGWLEKYKLQKGRCCKGFSVCEDKSLIENFQLLGRVNLYNLAAAVSICDCFEIDRKVLAEAVKDFKSLPHRLEFVANKDGVSWYNDSIATTPQSTIAAIEALDCPKIIIAGGYDKKLSFKDLGKALSQKAKAVILIGESAAAIREAIQESGGNCHIEMADSLSDAVLFAKKLGCVGDAVVLSPACASYDMFANFQDRGEKFIQLVKSL